MDLGSRGQKGDGSQILNIGSNRSDDGDVPGCESCILHLRRLDGVECDGEDQGEEPRVHTCNQCIAKGQCHKMNIFLKQAKTSY